MQRASTHARFFDHAGPFGCSRSRAHPCCLPHSCNGVGTRDNNLCDAQWLACAFPYRRFAAVLTDDRARLGADVVSYSFIVSDLHASAEGVKAVMELADVAGHKPEEFLDTSLIDELNANGFVKSLG